METKHDEAANRFIWGAYDVVGRVWLTWEVVEDRVASCCVYGCCVDMFFLVQFLIPSGGGQRTKKKDEDSRPREIGESSIHR